ncbi:MAG: hypothetical protein L7H10_00970 [Vulcanisaeta sp.]|nr:hypothetical protein [Vulcanisaeta sp.]MCG2869299.1 hypothetical protein [Vulcanisaeta sp.]
MPPEAVPIINRGIRYLPRLVFTNKLAIELDGEVDQGRIRRLKSLSRELIGIVRVRDLLGIKIPKSLRYFDKAIVIMNSRVGASWLKYVIELTNTIAGLTLDALIKLVNIKPHLLDLPSELFVDPIIDGDVQVIPRELHKSVVDWLLDYVDSGGDLYVLARDYSIGSVELLVRSSLVFTYNVELAEVYNSIVRGGLNNEVRIVPDCDVCGALRSPECILICPNAGLVRELRVD